MVNNLAQKAISQALKGNWKEAIELNKEILRKTPNDLEALNRLARAYAETGDTKKAKTISKKVLKIDPFNPIAQKCAKKWEKFKNGPTTDVAPKPTANIFLEEPGKTKIVSLIRLGDESTLACLDSGDEVSMNLKTHRVSIASMDGKHIGVLPDDIAARLKKLSKSGNKYMSLIKKSEPKEVVLFIREIFRSKRVKDVASFPSEKINYVSFTPPELVHKKKPEIETESEE